MKFWMRVAILASLWVSTLCGIAALIPQTYNGRNYSVSSQNGRNYLGLPIVATPTALPVGGTYASAFTITITCPAGATCGYTVDGSIPTALNGTVTHGTVYSAPFTSPATSFTLQVIGTRSGWVNSALLVIAYSISGGGGASCPTNSFYPIAPTNTYTTLAAIGVTNCRYASKSTGSDTLYDGTTEAISGGHGPWAHIPGMYGCTGNCASFTPTAGTGLILKGNDQWVNADLGIVFTWAGTSSQPIYVGVDPAWFSGASWGRPVLTCQASACAGGPSNSNLYNYWMPVKSYDILDEIEMTGLFTTGNASQPSYINDQLDHEVVYRSYFHGWTIQAGATHDEFVAVNFAHNNFSPFNNVGSGLFYSIVDGFDSSDPAGGQHSGTGLELAVTYIAGNVIQNTSNGLNVGFYSMHDNYFGAVNQSYAAGAHQNNVLITGSDNGQTSQFLYNNVITGTVSPGCGTVCGGIVKLWLNQNPVTGLTGYAWNNIMFNNATGNLIDHGRIGVANYETWNFFNNTIECGQDSSTGTCYSDSGQVAGATAIFNSQNNHWITSVGTAVVCTVYTCTRTTDEIQTVAAANAQGYVSTGAFAFAPVNGSGATIGTGTNSQSMCSTISGLDPATGAACQFDTGYGCAYNITARTLTCPDRTEKARQVSPTAWDIGAYKWP